VKEAAVAKIRPATFIVACEDRRCEGLTVVGGRLRITERVSTVCVLECPDDDAQLEYMFTGWFYTVKPGTVVYIYDSAYDRLRLPYWDLISRCLKRIYGKETGAYYRVLKP
jgi:hypothetical protein